MIKEGDYVYFPDVIRAGIYKIEKFKTGALYLYRNGCGVPYSEELKLKAIKQPFNSRWDKDWEDVEGTLNFNMHTKKVNFEKELLMPGTYSGFSQWYEYTPEIFPYEELNT